MSVLSAWQAPAEPEPQESAGIAVGRTSLSYTPWALAWQRSLAQLSYLAAPPDWLTPYRVEINQGNYVTQDMVAKLKPGMTRNQVRFILGTPLVVDPFRTDRWDYVYVYYKAGKLAEQKRITLFFEGDTLTRIDGDLPEPATQPPATGVTPDPQATPTPQLAPSTATSPAVEPAPQPEPAAQPIPEGSVAPTPQGVQP